MQVSFHLQALNGLTSFPIIGHKFQVHEFFYLQHMGLREIIQPRTNEGVSYCKHFWNRNDNKLIRLASLSLRSERETKKI